MEERVRDVRRVRKRHFINLSKQINAAFYWFVDFRRGFAQYMRNMGWNVIECPTEAGIAIAHACQLNDIILSSDSDMLAYDTITTIWRPMSRRKFLVYDVPIYVDKLKDVEAHLDSFYNCRMVPKNYKWDARRVWGEEYKQTANRLLKLVSESIGAKREDSNKVVIGVGLGKFSTKTKLSFLHESFQSYFVQKASGRMMSLSDPAIALSCGTSRLLSPLPPICF
ncbi:hypothetical protein BC939DRAFT_489849 [Gamsiella multidivaricata]|uniref:uncharacterized protein n=1 Tax=Gamsiella multidivaricata TaxID=101098 RepID=UPI00221FC8EB|nr:uncharacterized protein BC939DRAFT_489849 [Gamsiella multidivaricata]KAI7830486.1 hypothetical protein BC939DRAFT_489849 [Gamsiella multidivaricata]